MSPKWHLQGPFFGSTNPTRVTESKDLGLKKMIRELPIHISALRNECHTGKARKAGKIFKKTSNLMGIL